MVPDTALLNTQHKVKIKGKIEQSREWSSALLLHLGVVAIEKGAFRSPSTKVANFTFTYIKVKINNTQQNSECDCDETVDHVSECGKLRV